MPVKNIDIKNKLKKLVGKDNLILTGTGNKAILYALRAMKRIGKKKLVIQDQGGWITYTQYAKKLKFGIVVLRTDYGILKPSELIKNIDEDSVLLYTSMAGYHAVQPCEEIAKICKKKDCIVINDASGSIGRDEAKSGDIVICSMGEGKPIDYGKGGFLAYNDDIKDVFEKLEMHTLELDDENREKLYKKILGLDRRLEILTILHNKVKDGLKEMKIIHKDKEGINVIVKFNSNEEKQKITSYCRKNDLEFEECPRDIRVKEDAISIEIKRKITEI